MTTIDAIQAFFKNQDANVLARRDVSVAVDAVLRSAAFRQFLLSVIEADVFAADFGSSFSASGTTEAIAPARMLSGSLGFSLRQFFALVGQVADAFGDERSYWSTFADRVHASPALADTRLSTYLTSMLSDDECKAYYRALVDRLIVENPHALYQTSPYRRCDGRVTGTADNGSVEAVMNLQTFASIRMIDHVLDIDQPALKNVYRPLGRCVCIIDRNVDALYGERLERYFRAHGIVLETLVYRAMEADKGLATVERMLGDFKRVGIARNEPVLIVGGGVLADTGGLACALYGRSTPYVMLATSIVSGIDAGPSPRTCCDGFGYKNLVGAYHPPVLCITDRFFFGTLHEGWLRHGVAEIIKIAAVANAELFAELEAAQTDLVPTRFGTVGCTETDAIHHAFAAHSFRCDALVHRGRVRQPLRNAPMPAACLRPHVVAGIRDRSGFAPRPRRCNRHGLRCISELPTRVDRSNGVRAHSRQHQRLWFESLSRDSRRRSGHVGKPSQDHSEARRQFGRPAAARRHRQLRLSQRSFTQRIFRRTDRIPPSLRSVSASRSRYRSAVQRCRSRRSVAGDRVAHARERSGVTPAALRRTCPGRDSNPHGLAATDT